MRHSIRHTIRQLRIKLSTVIAGKFAGPFTHNLVDIPEPLNALDEVKIYEISITAIFRNEASYLQEWIDFHIRSGVDHFFLYDNGSEDNFMEILAKYIHNGKVTLMPWPMAYSRSTQLFAYAHSVMTNRACTEWMLFIDIDEFIFPLNSKDLKEYVRKNKDMSAIYVPWNCFGSDGHSFPPSSRVLESYFYSADISKADNVMKKNLTELKTLARTSAISKVKVHDTKVRGLTKIEDEELLLNHYITKSVEDLWKKNQVDGFISGQEKIKTREKREKIHEFILRNSNRDDRIVRYLNQ